MKREIYLKEIIEEFSILKSKIELLSKVNFLDINLISEYHIQEILNVVFDLKLINSNLQNKNAKAIDLQDEVNCLAVQVTSNYKKIKVQDTLDKFFEETLENKFSTLLVFILGKKQLKYQNLVIKEGFNFDPDEHIFDFSKLIWKLTTLPINKIEKVRDILKRDRIHIQSKIGTKSVFKSKQIIKKKIIKNLINVQDVNIATISYYDPSYKFIYEDLIIRSIVDKTYPNFDDEKTGERGDWYKVFSHDLNEHYLEVETFYNVEIVYDNKGIWNYLNERNKVNLPKDLNIGNFRVLQRIALEDIVEIDTNCDDPMIFVQFKNHQAYFEEIPFIRGYFNNTKDCRMVAYFELKNQNINL